MEHQLKVKGMHCAHCVQAVTDALINAGAADVKVSLEEQTATFSSSLLDEKPFIEAIKNAGFKAKK